jgi:hypothetical protein
VSSYAALPLVRDDAEESVRAGPIAGNESEPQAIAHGVRPVSLGMRNYEVFRARLKRHRRRSPRQDY